MSGMPWLSAQAAKTAVSCQWKQCFYALNHDGSLSDYSVTVSSSRDQQIEVQLSNENFHKTDPNQHVLYQLTYGGSSHVYRLDGFQTCTFLTPAFQQLGATVGLA